MAYESSSTTGDESNTVVTPKRPRRQRRATAEVVRDRLTPAQWAVLQLLGRRTLCTSRQVARELFPNHKDRTSAEAETKRIFSALVRLKVVKREQFPRRPKSSAPRAYFGLAPLGAAILNSSDWGESDVRFKALPDLQPSAAELRAAEDGVEPETEKKGRSTARHDVQVGDDFTTLRRWVESNPVARVLFPEGETDVRLSMPADYWREGSAFDNAWSGAQLAMGYTQPQLRRGEKVRRGTCIPDGVLALGVELVDVDGQLRSCSLPLLYQNDMGTKKATGTEGESLSEQILEDILFSYTPAVAARLPQTDVALPAGLTDADGRPARYLVPTLWVLRNSTKPRTQRACRAVAEGLQHQRPLDDHLRRLGSPPHYVVRAEDLDSNGFMAKAWCANRPTEKPAPLVQALLVDSQLLIRYGRFAADDELVIDRNAAKARDFDRVSETQAERDRRAEQVATYEAGVPERAAKRAQREAAEARLAARLTAASARAAAGGSR